MAKITLVLGVLLIILGVGAYSVSTSDKPETALIPAYIGGLFLVFGGLMLPKVKLLTIIVAHLAVVIAALAPGGIIVRWAGGNFGTALATFVQIATLVLLWGYVAIGVRSFIVARKQRKLAAA
ncbi:MAG: hypothetical protein AAGD32_00995 [Planctomycetota bacterium]